MNQLPVSVLNSIDVFENRIDEALRHVANGGSLTQYCKMNRCDYAALMSRIRGNEDILKRYKDAMADRREWAKERIYEELQYMAAYNIQDAVNPDGTLKRVQDLPEDLARSIKEVDADGGIKFQDKLKALDQKTKLLGLSSEKVEVTGTLSLADLILKAKAIKEGNK